MQKSVHDGHRERMRARIQESGLNSLKDHEIIEYLLYAFIPRKDTNEIAHELIKQFGSFSGVMNADSEHLQSVKGMTQNAAIFLANVPDIGRRYISDYNSGKQNLSGRGRAKEFMQRRMICSNTEKLFVASLDAKDQLIACDNLSSGTGDSVSISVREIVDYALKSKASSVLLAHNHPSGDVTPSQQDYILTREIAWTLYSVNVCLQDHYIFGGNDCFSFEESGRLKLMMEERDLQLKEGIMYYE